MDVLVHYAQKLRQTTAQSKRRVGGQNTSSCVIFPPESCLTVVLPNEQAEGGSPTGQ